jgi:hypothetical protein
LISSNAALLWLPGSCPGEAEAVAAVALGWRLKSAPETDVEKPWFLQEHHWKMIKMMVFHIEQPVYPRVDLKVICDIW